MTILVCGYGRAGRQVASILMANGVPAGALVVLDRDDTAAAVARSDGIPTIVGDAARSARLRVAGAGFADAAVVAVGDESATEVLRAVRTIAPDLRTYVLLRGPERRDVARRYGADAVVVIAEVAGQLLAEAVQWRSTTASQ